MNVNPASSGQARGPAADRLREPPASPLAPKDRGVEPEAAPARADQVELSEAARALQQQPGLAPTVVSSLTPERMKEVLQRITQVFYDRPEVRDQVLRRMAGDLEHGPSGI